MSSALCCPAGALQVQTDVQASEDSSAPSSDSLGYYWGLPKDQKDGQGAGASLQHLQKVSEGKAKSSGGQSGFYFSHVRCCPLGLCAWAGLQCCLMHDQPCMWGGLLLGTCAVQDTPLKQGLPVSGGACPAVPCAASTASALQHLPSDSICAMASAQLAGAEARALQSAHMQLLAGHSARLEGSLEQAGSELVRADTGARGALRAAAPQKGAAASRRPQQSCLQGCPGLPGHRQPAAAARAAQPAGALLSGGCTQGRSGTRYASEGPPRIPPQILLHQSDSRGGQGQAGSGCRRACQGRLALTWPNTVLQTHVLFYCTGCWPTKPLL